MKSQHNDQRDTEGSILLQESGDFLQQKYKVEGQGIQLLSSQLCILDSIDLVVWFISLQVYRVVQQDTAGAYTGGQRSNHPT